MPRLTRQAWLQRRGQERARAVVACVVPWYTLRGQGLSRTDYRHVPTLREHARIEEEGLADGVLTRGLMDVA